MKENIEKNKWNIHFTGPQIRVRNENYFSYFSTKTYVVDTQKNRFDETVLLSIRTVSMRRFFRASKTLFQLMGKKIIAILHKQ